MLLNYCGLITYNKKDGSIRIAHNPSSSSIIPRNMFITPQKPFSNVLALRKIIRHSLGFIYWVDKHLGRKVLELLCEELDGNVIQEVRLLGSINVNEDLARIRSDFKRFKVEMGFKKIQAHFKILVDKTIINSIHDRWVTTENKQYNVPPLNSLLQGQASEIIETSTRPPFEGWWCHAKDILSGWGEISKHASRKCAVDGCTR